jgi:small subunit ribosomal protein S17
MAKQQATQTPDRPKAHTGSTKAGRTQAGDAKRALLRTIQGVVGSDKGDKTIKVVVAYQTRHEKYGKFLKRRTVLHAHDEKNEAKEGDTVEIAECRPISKTKHHRLLRVVERAPERAVQVSAEEVMTGKAPEER